MWGALCCPSPVHRQLAFTPAMLHEMVMGALPWRRDSASGAMHWGEEVPRAALQELNIRYREEQSKGTHGTSLPSDLAAKGGGCCDSGFCPLSTTGITMCSQHKRGLIVTSRTPGFPPPCSTIALQQDHEGAHLCLFPHLLTGPG